MTARQCIECDRIIDSELYQLWTSNGEGPLHETCFNVRHPGEEKHGPPAAVNDILTPGVGTPPGWVMVAPDGRVHGVIELRAGWIVRREEPGDWESLQAAEVG